jgi:hypothetical protein
MADTSNSLQGIEREAEELDKMVLREVPVTWQGVASDVRLLGDFDNWTKGFGLSPGETQDATFTKFTANIPLPPVSLPTSVPDSRQKVPLLLRPSVLCSTKKRPCTLEIGLQMQQAM